MFEIAEREWPATLEIDEEGRFKHLIADCVDAVNDLVEFQVLDDNEAILMRCRVDRVPLLRELSQCLSDWLATKYDPGEFRTRSDLRSLERVMHFQVATM